MKAIQKRFRFLQALPFATQKNRGLEPTTLKFTMLGAEELKAHAVGLAQMQQVGPVKIKRSLQERLAVNERWLAEAHSVLSGAASRRESVSPAGEWFLDNYHLIEEEIRLTKSHLPRSYSRELPHLANTRSAGFPRVYDLALELIANVDGRVDEQNISCFVAAFQSVTKLQVGEMWAVPIMLRLALIENLSRVGASVVASIEDRRRASSWADRLSECAEKSPRDLLFLSAELAQQKFEISPAFVSEFERRLQGQDGLLEIPLNWIEHELSEAGLSPQRAVEQESQQQAANQVSTSACIGSLRFLNAMNWRTFVESNCAIDAVLAADPAHCYSKMDFLTRDRYRHVVEKLSRRSESSEEDVAKIALQLAQERPETQPHEKHVGYFLIDDGLAELRREIGLKPVWGFSRRLSPRKSLCLYVATLLLADISATGYLLHHFHNAFEKPWLIVAACLLFLVVSDFAVALLNWLVMAVLSPQRLPRMDFSAGIPADCKTVVVVPTLLTTNAAVDALVDGLEVRFLANRDENLRFGLLTDFVDAASAQTADDDALLSRVVKGIEKLNRRHGSTEDGPFFLLHRSRVWVSAENSWMGFERKRGKLEALNRYLRAPDESTAFSTKAGDLKTFGDVRFVITLDTDTLLPRDGARKLVAAISHPLNRAQFDRNVGRVTRGYAILQPRIDTALNGARASLFVRLQVGEVGLDPYTSAVSDVYQDLLQEGSFVGKGIYDVDAFTSALHGALPDNLILSHDLIEGAYARAGLLSDVTLVEAFPPNYDDDVKRRHRWVRGDWQISRWLLPWLRTSGAKFRRNPISAISRWKILDNLRRSLVPAAALLLLVMGGVQLADGTAGKFSALIVALLLLPNILTSLATAVRKPKDAPISLHLEGAARTLMQHLLRGILNIVLLPYEAFVQTDAIVRSHIRMWLTKKRLLEWRSISGLSGSARVNLFQSYRAMLLPVAAALIVALLISNGWHISGLATFHPRYQLFLLFSGWIFSPAIAYLISRPIRSGIQLPMREDAAYLQRIARHTWKFFETFVGPDENWLPPDNFQEYPAPVVAHRTSPTNIGLSLLANLSAYDFGYISRERLLERSRGTAGSVSKLERFRGHLYNWYDTLTLKPLLPMYISTVDSGNFVGALLTLKAGLREIRKHSLVSEQQWARLREDLDCLKRTSKDSRAFRSIDDILREVPSSAAAWRDLPLRWKDAVATLPSSAPAEERLAWANLQRDFDEVCGDALHVLKPWLALGKPPENLWEGQDPNGFRRNLRARIARWERIPSLRRAGRGETEFVRAIQEVRAELVQADVTAREWLDQLEKAVREISSYANKQLSQIDELCRWCDTLSNIEYEFLYDRQRNLLAIGYNAGDHRRDAGFYDLLASEARLASFVGIAQGHLPQDHWFSLGRQLTRVGSESALLSWSGSMFEYLMPMLVMPSYQNTLLHRTCQAVVRRQIAYAEDRGVPWGISESGYNVTDAHLNYQYRAFGVPGLGLKRGLSDDLVIAPYAAVMALMVAPRETCRNLRRMTSLGYEGQYGFYEAVDFTAKRVGAGETCAIIKSFMAHHQGMAFLSLAYHLLGPKMQRRFMADPALRATELLLHERVPKVAAVFPHASEVSPEHQYELSHGAPLRVIESPNTPQPEAHLLSNGSYSVMLTNSGGGYSKWKGLMLTRWREDSTCDSWGMFCYLRDLEERKTWSVSYHPTLALGEYYAAIFLQSRAEYRSRENGIDVHTEVTISPEDDVEIRRLTLTNLTDQPRTLELTTFAEVVLAPAAADDAHPAFSNLFIRTEVVEEKNTILCSRRSRFENDHSPVLAHFFSVHDGAAGSPIFETNRARFIGRGRTVTAPRALDFEEGAAESGAAPDGAVLDPIISIRHRITLAPEQTIHAHFGIAIASNAESALRLADRYRDRHQADRVFELSWTHRQVVLRQLNIEENDAQNYARLAGSILYADPARRAPAALIAKNRRGQSGLWGHGISGDLPIVVLHFKFHQNFDIVRQLVQAHSYWRLLGLHVDLVILNEDDSGYRQELQEQIQSMVAGASLDLVERPGGIFVRRTDQMSEEDRVLIGSVARIVWSNTSDDLVALVERKIRPITLPPPLTIERSERNADSEQKKLRKRADMVLENGLGGFSQDGQEYIVYTRSTSRSPAPWSNVLANPYFGSVVSESGAAYTWCENAHEFRLTPWMTDPVTDQSGEVFYLRDDETGEFWSPTPLPTSIEDEYETRHGFGYSIFSVAHAGVDSQLTTFVAIDAPVKITTLRLRNDSGRDRKLSVTGYVEWVLGESRAKNSMHISTEVDPRTSALLARNPYHPEFGGRIGFFDVSEAQRTCTGDRGEFIGRNGNLGNPAALARSYLSGRTTSGIDSCGAIQTEILLRAGESREISFVLGMSRDVEDARTLLRRFGGLSNAQRALAEVRSHWRSVLGMVQVETPDRATDFLANGWLLYQVLACRMWARSGYYQSGGAFGFRDQLQDAMALLHSRPLLLREHIVRCAGRQFREGDVQHWWHPPSGLGVRTRFSDDFLWLPLAVSRYVTATGDTGILDERVHFIEGRHVGPEEEAYAEIPKRSDEFANVYEHCVRSLRHGLRFGRHGLPLMGTGDWNDGMNLVGFGGKGESVWLAFFLYDVLQQFERIASIKNDESLIKLCKESARALSENLEKNAWDGEWYRRAYFDSGEPLGSRDNSECQIDSLPQSWAILSGAVETARARQGMQAVLNRLVDKKNGIIKLFDPPFDRTPLNPGYVKSYVPGVRENGGQYTHAAIWTVMAFAKLGEYETAWDLFSMINPVKHGDDPSKIPVYRAEPYVVAADVYSVTPHEGRGGWTWYTGSAGWMYRLVLESILGIELDNNRLLLKPAVPAGWSLYTVRYRYRSAQYNLKFVRKGEAACSLLVDGISKPGSTLELLDDGKEHEVEVRF